MIQGPPEPMFRIETRGGIVKIWHARSARSLDEVDVVLRAIDSALQRTGLEVLLFDSRDSDRTPADVQERIWNWLTSHRSLRRVATLMHSTELGSSVRTVGLDRGIRIRAFADEETARQWLLG